MLIYLLSTFDFHYGFFGQQTSLPSVSLTPVVIAHLNFKTTYIDDGQLLFLLYYTQVPLALYILLVFEFYLIYYNSSPKHTRTFFGFSLTISPCTSSSSRQLSSQFSSFSSLLVSCSPTEFVCSPPFRPSSGSLSISASNKSLFAARGCGENNFNINTRKYNYL